jgi:chlorophyllide a reductase subunit Y
MAGIVAAQTRGAERFRTMVGFFDGVGTIDRAGYGFTGKPDDPAGFRERLSKQREARRKAEEAVGS